MKWAKRNAKEKMRKMKLKKRKWWWVFSTSRKLQNRFVYFTSCTHPAYSIEIANNRFLFLLFFTSLRYHSLHRERKKRFLFGLSIFDCLMKACATTVRLENLRSNRNIKSKNGDGKPHLTKSMKIDLRFLVNNELNKRNTRKSIKENCYSFS